MTWEWIAFIAIVGVWVVAMNWIHQHYNYKNMSNIPEAARLEAARKEMEK